MVPRVHIGRGTEGMPDLQNSLASFMQHPRCGPDRFSLYTLLLL